MKLVELGSNNFHEFANFLGGSEFGGCFCAVWTHFGDDWGDRCKRTDRPNLHATRRDVKAGRKPGFLVDVDGEFVAWTGAGPKSEFPLLASRLGARRSENLEDAWCIGCLAIRNDFRGRGLAEEIVANVLGAAREDGVKKVEAYPTDPWDEPRSYRGSLKLYRRLGFEEVCRERDGESEIVLVEIKL